MAMNEVRIFGIQNELEVMIQHKVGILHEISRSLLGQRMGNSQLTEIGQHFVSLNTVDTVEGQSLTICENILNNCTAPYFKHRGADYQPSRQEINLIYGSERYRIYDGDQQHKNIAKLFSALKATTEYQQCLEINPNFDSSLVDLESELTQRLNVYHKIDATRHIGRTMIDNAIEHLEIYVTKIVNSRLSRVTHASVERSLIVLTATVGQDLAGGCSTGLNGRVLAMLLALTSNLGDDLQNHLQEFRQEVMEKAFESLHGGSIESSMFVSYKSEALNFLANSEMNFNQLNKHSQTLLSEFFHLYTPVTIYHKARTFFADKFWQLNLEEDHKGIYEMLERLGFSASHAELDSKYRVAGNAENKWQYGFFQQDLPQYLVPFLLKETLLSPKSIIGPKIIFQKEGQSEIDLNQSFNAHRVGNSASMANRVNRHSQPSMSSSSAVQNSSNSQQIGWALPSIEYSTS